MAVNVDALINDIEQTVQSHEPEATVEIVSATATGVTIRIKGLGDAESRLDRSLELDPTVQGMARHDGVTPRQFLQRLNKSGKELRQAGFQRGRGTAA